MRPSLKIGKLVLDRILTLNWNGMALSNSNLIKPVIRRRISI